MTDNSTAEKFLVEVERLNGRLNAQNPGVSRATIGNIADIIDTQPSKSHSKAWSDLRLFLDNMRQSPHEDQQTIDGINAIMNNIESNPGPDTDVNKLYHQIKARFNLS